MYLPINGCTAKSRKALKNIVQVYQIIVQPSYRRKMMKYPIEPFQRYELSALYEASHPSIAASELPAAAELVAT